MPSPTPKFSPFEEATRIKLRDYFDKYRGGLPPDLVGQLDGCLLRDTELMDHWRDWQKGLRQSDTVMSAVLCGAMDDCLVQNNEYYIPIEFRMVSREPHEDEIKDRELFMDGLTYLLTANGYKTLECGYVIFYFPQSVALHHALMLKTKVVRIDTDLMRTEKIFYEAADLLRGRAVPEEGVGCFYCTWFDARSVVKQYKK